jgi:hypothetical protein
MSDTLRVQIEITLPDWYVARYGLPGTAFGTYAAFSPDADDDNIASVIHAALGNLRGEIRNSLRESEDVAR